MADSSLKVRTYKHRLCPVYEQKPTHTPEDKKMASKRCFNSTWPLSAAQVERFWATVSRAGADECWEWKKSKIGAGYGLTSIFLEGTRYTANRLAWAIANDQPVPADMYVLHHCDNPSCCNPAHLYIGSQAANMRDMYQRGRRKVNGGNPTLKVDQVVELRERYADGEPAADIARSYGVSISAITRIGSGKTWTRSPGTITTGIERRIASSGSRGLKADQVVELRERYAAGEPVADIARDYGVSAATVYLAGAGQSWATLPGPITARKERIVAAARYLQESRG